MPHEETRKIIRVGNSLAVTMPKDWVQYFQLNQGDEVKVVSNGSIVIMPPKKAETSQKTQPGSPPT
jgi:antitoxin component of MazEF toxin-antitoxin module